MANKYLDSAGLSRYHAKIKALIDAKADGSATSGAIETLTTNLASEASTRSSADSALSGRITTLENAGFITKTVNNLTNYYTKSESYTKTEVNTLIGNLKTIQISVVSSLPSTGQSNIIYLVAHSHGTGDTYDEYIWVADSSKFEKIGNTDIDLSGYVPTSRTVNGKALSSNITIVASDISDVYSKTEVDNIASGKVDKVTGKGLSTNDYTTTEKNKLSGIASGAQVNVIETIKVNNTAQTVTSKAVNITVPTKVSDLTNDSGFITGVTSISNSEIDALFA